MVHNLPLYMKTIKHKISELEQKIKCCSYECTENELVDKSKLLEEFNLIVSEINVNFQKTQLELIEKFNEFTSEKNKDSILIIKNENSNLIKTFKISNNVVEYYKHLSLVKLNDHLEKIFNQLKIENENKNFKKFIFYNKIINREFDLNAHEDLEYLKNVLRLLKKNKLRIDNFINKHILPLAGIIDEKYNDFQNSIKNELELFKNFNPEIHTLNKNSDLYELKRFGYDQQLLSKFQVRHKIDIFNLFHEITEIEYIKMLKYKESQNDIKSMTFSSPYCKRIELISEKLSEIALFLNQDFKQIINEFSVYLNNINISITNSSDFKDKENIISVWDKKDFIQFLNEKFQIMIKEINNKFSY
jgi:hypothetical protein